MENLHNVDGFPLKQDGSSNCCPPDNNNASCCPPTTHAVKAEKAGFKKGLGLLILGIAFVLAISSAFKIATGAEEIDLLPPAIEDFAWMDSDKEVVFVLLKGDDEKENKSLSSQLSDVVLELNATSGSVEHLELTPSYEQYASFVDIIGIEETPAIAVLGRKGNKYSVLDKETISSIQLYKAYIAGITPVATCKSTTCSPSTSCTPAQKAACTAKKIN